MGDDAGGSVDLSRVLFEGREGGLERGKSVRSSGLFQTAAIPHMRLLSILILTFFRSLPLNQSLSTMDMSWHLQQADRAILTI